MSEMSTLSLAMPDATAAPRTYPVPANSKCNLDQSVSGSTHLTQPRRNCLTDEMIHGAPADVFLTSIIFFLMQYNLLLLDISRSPSVECFTLRTCTCTQLPPMPRLQPLFVAVQSSAPLHPIEPVPDVTRRTSFPIYSFRTDRIVPRETSTLEAGE